ncbi:MAG TPA: alpha/beta hydrolase [Xanthobacteraceae bacterium]|nr:alpha/beta hydrolase [Xanthobacteraceae bacterium]
MQQTIQYCTTPDGVRLAYSIIGKGPKLVRTPHWFSHLEHDLESQVLRHTILALAHHHAVLRYDARGIGMSQREGVDINFDKFVQDLETVVDAAGFERFILFGLSQGCAQAIAYATRHPERVSHLILYGGFARGSLRHDDAEKQKEAFELVRGLVRAGWGSDQESHRQFFTSQFIPDGTSGEYHSLNEMQRMAATPEMAEQFMLTNANIDILDLLPQVKVPTLVLHAKRETRVPVELGHELAANIPGAKFVGLESRNHLILAEERAHRAMVDAICDFLGEKRIRGALPGTKSVGQRLEGAMSGLERNWFIKFVIIFAAVTGVVIFFVEMWHLLRP